MGGFAPNTEINANTDIISHRKKEHYHRVEMNYRLGRSTGAFGAELNYTPTICNNVPNPPTTRTSVILVVETRLETQQMLAYNQKASPTVNMNYTALRKFLVLFALTPLVSCYALQVSVR